MGQHQAHLRSHTSLAESLGEARANEPVLAPVRAVPCIPNLTVTQADLIRLTGVLDAMGPLHEDAADRLHEELQRATVVPSEQVASDVVTMNSRVVYRDESGRVQREVTVVYPDEADAAQQRVSILSPLGSALFGLRVGQAIEWHLPNGQLKRYRVLALPYQPEANGHFQL